MRTLDAISGTDLVVDATKTGLSEHTTFVEAYEDGRELHRSSPLVTIDLLDKRVQDAVEELKDFLFSGGELNVSSINFAGLTNPWLFDDFAIEGPLASDVGADLLLEVFTEYAQQLAGQLSYGEQITAIDARLQMPESGEVRLPINIMHTDVDYEVGEDSSLVEIKADLTRTKLVAVMTLDPNGEEQSNGTVYLDGKFTVPKTLLVPATAKSEQEMYIELTDPESAVVTTAKSIVRLPLEGWLPPLDMQYTHPEGAIAEIGALCVHKGVRSSSHLRLALIATKRLQV